MILTSLTRFREAGLLFMRVALGCFYIYAHGWPKLVGGIAKWKAVGTAMKHVGITFAPAFWGFMAAFSESIGCALFVLGLFFRPSCILLVITISVASIMHYHNGGVVKASHAIELAIVFFSLIFIGPGKFSVDKN